MTFKQGMLLIFQALLPTAVLLISLSFAGGRVVESIETIKDSVVKIETRLSLLEKAANDLREIRREQRELKSRVKTLEGKHG